MVWLLIALILGQADPSAVRTEPAEVPAAVQPDAPAAEPKPAEPKPAESASPAQEPAAGNTASGTGAKDDAKGWLHDVLHTGAMGYMLAGGLFMWPLLLLGIVAMGVIIERYRALMMLNTRAEGLRARVRELLEADQVEEALQLCDREQGPVPAILAAGLRKYLLARRLGYDAARVEEQVVKGMDDYSIHIVAAMERHLPILATVSSAAPMIGFLGTVQGMVQSFADIVAKMGEMNIVQAAADGIKVSLLTTVLGLIVGIPAFIAFNYFTSAVNQFILDVEESASELIEAVTMQLAFSQRTAEPTEASVSNS